MIVAKLIKLLSPLAILINVNCSSSVDSFREENSRQLASEFIEGKIELTCKLACSGRAGWNLPNLKELYERHEWQELSKEIIRIGYKDDLRYYYLGRAAEGLGATQAARVYYLKAIQLSKSDNSNACHWGFDNCEGIAVNDFANSGLRRLQ